MSSTPVSTYRLQLTADFTLSDAAGLAEYLRDLGADWFYLSPILQATAGSTHGYDVVDHARVDASRGGEDGLRALSSAAREHDLGVLVDIVPNHMGVGKARENAWWWDVLQHGQESEYASYFDIDWAAGDGRVLIPVLGESLEEARESGALRVVGDELRYHEHRFPASGQYELVAWQRADTDLNYRRFFAVTELAAIRVEVPEVFDASHVAITSWVRGELVDGIRVDHPDGLADPGGYLDRLNDALRGAFVVVEKILEPGEQLPAFWAAAGTTGYEALGEIDRVLIDADGARALTRLDASLRPAEPREWAEVVHDSKRAVADGILQSEVRRISRDLGRPDAADAVAELLACFPVYRTYLPLGVEHLDAALADAARRRPELAGVLDELSPPLHDPSHPGAIRFQQTSGMVMAKGVEDSAYYRVARLASLTEVGADPDEFALSPARFHEHQIQRGAAHPHGLIALTTHDTKRGEDTRARIGVLSELPEEWEAFLGRHHGSLGDGALENLLWQSVIGSWPREREALHGYAEKAAREAGTSTTWAVPDEEFEERLHAFIDRFFDDPDVRRDVEQLVTRLQPYGWSNSLSAKLLQITAPGVPDVYQGTELWEYSLVDPDNRRTVDFGLRRLLLAAIDAGAHPPVDETGAAKLLVTSRALRARRDHPEAFDRYSPLPVVGSAADHLIAVDRGRAVVLTTRLPVGLERAGGWGDTHLLLPRVRYRDLISGAVFDGGEVPVSELLQRYPVALLLRDQP